MKSLERDRLAPEFGVYSQWLVDAIFQLDLEDAIPAASRGTAHPQLLARMADLLAIERESFVVDLGSGLGGPAAWLTTKYSCRVIGVDAMEIEVAGARRLFPEALGLVAVAGALPLRSGMFDAVWALGVIEMVVDKQGALDEMARVLRPGGRAAIYGFCANDAIVDAPGADRFEPLNDLVAHFETSGFRIVHVAPVEAGATPLYWREAADAARAEVRRHHADDMRLVLAETQRASFNWLRMTGRIHDFVVVGEKDV